MDDGICCCPRQKKEMLPKVHARTMGRRGEIVKVFTASISSQGDAKASAISRPFHPWTCVHRIKLKRQSSSSPILWWHRPLFIFFFFSYDRATLSTLRRLVYSCRSPRRRWRCWSSQHRNKREAPLKKFTPSQDTKNRFLNIAPPSPPPPVRSPARVGLTGEYGTKDRGGGGWSFFSSGRFDRRCPENRTRKEENFWLPSKEGTKEREVDDDELTFVPVH